jgi:hypothetical protein
MYADYACKTGPCAKSGHTNMAMMHAQYKHTIYLSDEVALNATVRLP